MFISQQGALRAVREAVVSGHIPASAKVIIQRAVKTAKGSRTVERGFAAWVEVNGHRFVLEG